MILWILVLITRVTKLIIGLVILGLTTWGLIRIFEVRIPKQQMKQS